MVEKLCYRCEHRAPFSCSHESTREVLKELAENSGRAIAFTGHRPKHFPALWSRQWAKERIESVIRRGYEEGYRWIVTGGALGVDLWAAEKTLLIKEEHPDLKLAVFLPHLEHGGRWRDPELVRRYWMVRRRADAVHVANVSYSVSAMHERNKRMVDHARLVVGFWNGEPAGGTYHCLQYAQKQPGKRVYWYNPVARIGKVLKGV